jgi:hypothetical protein
MARLRNDDEDERGPLRDGGKLVVSMLAMDSAAIAADGIPLDYHRPGFRFVGDRSAQDTAYYEMVKRQEAAWKTSAPTAVDDATAAESPFSEDPRVDAYLRSVRSLEHAWRGPR